VIKQHPHTGRATSQQQSHYLQPGTTAVSRLSIPRNHETIQVRTYSARRAQELMLETYPDCSARFRASSLSAVASH
jgi:hypothetical protein